MFNYDLKKYSVTEMRDVGNLKNCDLVFDHGRSAIYIVNGKGVFFKSQEKVRAFLDGGIEAIGELPRIDDKSKHIQPGDYALVSAVNGLRLLFIKKIKYGKMYVSETDAFTNHELNYFLSKCSVYLNRNCPPRELKIEKGSIHVGIDLSSGDLEYGESLLGISHNDLVLRKGRAGWGVANRRSVYKIKNSERANMGTVIERGDIIDVPLQPGNRSVLVQFDEVNPDGAVKMKILGISTPELLKGLSELTSNESEESREFTKDGIINMVRRNKEIDFDNFKHGADAYLQVYGINDIHLDDNGRRMTLLHMACNGEGEGRTSAVKYVLTKKANPNIKGSYGFTPLHIAASVGFEEAIVLLVKYGADLRARDDLGKLPSEYLPKDLDSNKKQRIMDLLQAGGDDVNDLFSALQVDDNNKVSIWLDGGGNPNEFLDGGHPLEIAVKNGSKKSIESLLIFGADPFDRCGMVPYKGMTIALMAAKTKDMDLLASILSGKSMPSQKDLRDVYLLTFSNENIVKLLLDLKIDLSDKVAGRPISDLAFERAPRVVCDIIISRGIVPPMFYYARFNDVEQVQELDVRGLKKRTFFGNTPISMAIDSNNIEFLKKSLTILGTEELTEIKDRKGNTPLHKLCDYDNRIQMLNLLIDDNANLNMLNDSSYSPLALAIVKGNRDVVRSLINAGADISVPDGLMVRNERGQRVHPKDLSAFSPNKKFEDWLKPLLK